MPTITYEFEELSLHPDGGYISADGSAEIEYDNPAEWSITGIYIDGPKGQKFELADKESDYPRILSALEDQCGAFIREAIEDDMDRIREDAAEDRRQDAMLGMDR